MLQAGDSSLARWADRYTRPIRVWIQPASNLPGWSSELVPLAQNAFNAWQSIFVPLRFELVGDSSAAEITVNWRAAFDGALVGATRRFRDQHGWLGRAEIQLALTTSSGAYMRPQQMSAVMIHEVGHALGIDHSPDAHDIMAERTGATFEPSARDVATLALIYSLPPGSVKR
jgi:predicted Zn-dependent protease